MYQNTVFDVRREVRLWEEEGELVGFARLEEPDGVVMQVHPRLRGSGSLEREMLEWAARFDPQSSTGLFKPLGTRQAYRGKDWARP